MGQSTRAIIGYELLPQRQPMDKNQYDQYHLGIIFQYGVDCFAVRPRRMLVNTEYVTLCGQHFLKSVSER
jgi:hypothetical protein